MASGFFLGGVASGFQKQEALNNQQNYQQGLLDIENKRLQQQQENIKRNEYMKLRAQAISDMQNTVTALKNAHPDWTDAQVMSFPALTHQRDMLSGFDKNLGLDPNGAQSILAGQVAGKSQIETEGAIARAKEGPQHQQLVQSEINKNNAVAGVDTNNPDRPGTGANGPALGGKPEAATFNQRFAQTNVQTSDPNVLTWGDARTQVARKYTPEIAMKAELWLKGNTSVVTGLRGSGAGQRNERAQIQNAAMDLARAVGMSADEINQKFVEFAGKKAAATAGGRTAGAREANLGIILAATDSAIDAAVTASNNVPRGDFVPLNTGKQWVEAQFSSEPLKIFQQKNLQLAELWAKSFNPTGAMRNEDRNYARGVLNQAIGNKTYSAAAHAIRDSIGLEKGAAIKYLKDRGFAGDKSDQDESGSGPGPGGVKIHGFTFTPTGQ